MKKDQNLPNKNIHSNSSSGKPLPNTSNYSRSQSPYNSNYRGRSPDQRKLRNFSQNRYSRSNSRNTQYRNNYSRSNSNRLDYSFDTSSHSHSRGRHYSNDRSRNLSIQKLQYIETEATQIIEINDVKIIDHEIIRITDQITKDLTKIVIKIDNEITNKIEIQVITIDKETTLNHLIGILHVILILKTNIEKIHRNIKDKQLKKITQTHLVLITQKLLKYN